MVDLALQLFVNGLIIGSLYALGGESWGLIYNTTFTFHYAACFIFSTAGYAAVLTAMNAGLPLGVSFLAAVFVAMIVGCGIELVIYRSLRERGAKLFNIFLASLGVATVGTALLQLFFTADSRPLSKFPKEMLSVGDVFFTNIDVLIVAVSWVSIGLVLVFLLKSKYGKVIRAVGANRELADISGLAANRVFFLVYAIGSGLFGIEAFLFALKYNATPYMGFTPFLMAFTAVFLGGEGTVLGSAMGGLFLGLAMQLGMIVLPGTYTLLVAFALLFIVLLVRPEGLFGGRNLV